MVTNKNLLIALLLIGVISICRFWSYPTWFSFDADQETLSFMVRQVVVDHKPMLIGMPTSVGGMFIGPLLTYILVPFYLLMNMSPLSPVLFIFLSSFFTLFSLFFVGTKIFSKQVGVFSVIVYAFSSLLCQFDRTFWNPTLMPLASIWLFYSLWNYLKNNKTKWLIVASIAVGLMANFHFTFVFGVAVLGSSLLILRRDFKGLIITGIVFSIFILPLVFFDFRHDHLIVNNILNFLTRGPEKGATILFHQPTISERIEIFFSVLGAVVYQLRSELIDVVVFGLWAGYALMVFIKRKDSINFLGQVLMLFFAGTSFLIMIINRGPFLPYYLLFLFPMWAWLLGFYLTLITKFSPLITTILIAGFLALNLPAIVNYESRFGYTYKQQVVDYILADSQKDTFKIDFVFEKKAPVYKAGYPYIFKWMGRDMNEDMTSTTVHKYKILVPYGFASKTEEEVRFGDFGVVKDY